MEQYVRIVTEKMLYFTAACSRMLGLRCDIYEHGRITAIVSTPMGKYHLSKKSELCKGLNLCSIELVSFLMEKYKIEKGGKLTAWTPVAGAEDVLFFSDEVSQDEAKQPFGKQFQQLTIPYRRRFGEWIFVEDRCISFTEGVLASLPPRLSLCGNSTCLALVGDPDGLFEVDRTGERKVGCIISTQLAHYCREKFADSERSVLFHARAMRNGVCFAQKEENLLAEGGRNKLRPVVLGTPKDQFLWLARGGNIYCSAKLAQAVGTRVDVYQAGNWLAFQSENDGEFEISTRGYQNNIWSKRLGQLIEGTYPDTQRIYFRAHGSFLVMVTDTTVLDEFPPLDNFRPVGGRTKQHQEKNGAQVRTQRVQPREKSCVI